MNLRPNPGPRVLVLAAHADDEALGALGWLWGNDGPAAIAFLTDGAPAARWRVPMESSRRAYRRSRRGEAHGLWQRLQPRARLYFGPVPDQRLAFHLPSAMAWLVMLARRLHPSLLLTPAFEGGHPDHDATNLLGAQLARRLGIAAWEYALYTARNGQILRQCFPAEPAWTVSLPPPAAAAKSRALASYRSQASTLCLFNPCQEAMRPLPYHDYSRPALAGPAVYELWGWPWRAQDIARHFARFLTSA